MKKWGLLVTSYYVLVVLAMFWPLFWTVWVALNDNGLFTWANFVRHFRDVYGEWTFALPVAIVFIGQILLLFVSVDASNRRLKPRASLALPAVLTGLFTAVIGFGACSSILVAIWRDKPFDHERFVYSYLLVWPLVWVIWSFFFYFRARNAENPIARSLSWLLKGSILEFLIAVPCHVIVRRRDDCCAPFATSLGMCTGLAIMLLAFGPSVLLLYKQRLSSYPTRTPQHQGQEDSP
jgi:hypothetical protein